MSYLIGILILFMFPMFAHGEIELTFERLPTLLKERNQEVRAGLILEEASETETGHLLRSYLPDVTVSAGGESFRFGPNGNFSQPYGSVLGNVNVFRSGRDVLEESSREAKAELTAAESRKSFFDVLKEARRKYWQLVYHRELLSIVKDAIEQNKKNAKAAAKRIEAGLASETDRIDFDLNKLNLDQRVLQLQIQIENCQQFLAALFNYPKDTQFVVPRTLPHIHEDEDSLGRFRAAEYPEILAARSKALSLQAQSAKSFRWWAPSVDIYGGYTLHTIREREFSNQSDRYEPVLGVQITLNVFDGLRSRTTGVATQMRAEALNKKAKQHERNIEGRWVATRKEITVTHKLIHASEEILSRAKKYLDRTVREYKRGVKNSPDVLGATSRYYDSRARVAAMKRDYLLAKVRLLDLMSR